MVLSTPSACTEPNLPNGTAGSSQGRGLRRRQTAAMAANRIFRPNNQQASRCPKQPATTPAGQDGGTLPLPSTIEIDGEYP